MNNALIVAIIMSSGLIVMPFLIVNALAKTTFSWNTLNGKKELVIVMSLEALCTILSPGAVLIAYVPMVALLSEYNNPETRKIWEQLELMVVEIYTTSLFAFLFLASIFTTAMLWRFYVKKHNQTN